MKPYELDKLNKIKKLISKIPNPNILELGVQKGNSTKMFLSICEKNDGKLTSIDIDDCSNVTSNSRWTFIHSSDDNFKYVIQKAIEERKTIGFMSDAAKKTYDGLLEWQREKGG